MARADLIKYVRTDKNGTKIFYDFTCPRCDGYGALDRWINTGKTCYACGGSGVRSVAKIIKEYTPEYRAKLEARQKAKDAKRAEEAKKYAEEHADEIAKIASKTIEFRYAQNGCGPDGIGYVLRGNTYPVKDEIKKAGGKWIYGVWICPVEIKGEEIRSKKIDLSGHIGSGSVIWLDGFDLFDAIQE